MKHRNFHVLVTTPIAAAALMLTGCSSEEPSTTETVTETSAPDSTWEPEAEPAFEEPAADAADDMTKDFGQSYEYEDGLTVTVDQLANYTPDEYAAGGEGHTSHVSFRVTVKNDTGAPFDPTMAMTGLQSGSGEGDPVFDDTVGGSPMTSVLDGREVSWTEAYGVDDPSDVVVEVAPSFDHDSSIFVGGVK